MTSTRSSHLQGFWRISKLFEEFITQFLSSAEIGGSIRIWFSPVLPLSCHFSIADTTDHGFSTPRSIVRCIQFFFHRRYRHSAVSVAMGRFLEYPGRMPFVLSLHAR